ncbi:SDR family oxidoreductase [Paenibacillaceae bacterium WGS1546]|uniref:SDR family oxidoreductase n=1 Tax=Cohnella sp. WGS1546 TaxID=3366810 RepID=UPI00372D1CCB
MNLKDQACVVTGAAHGIGLAICRQLVSAGAQVVLSDLDLAALTRAEAEFPSGRILTVPADVRSSAELVALAVETEKKLGPIAVWINNAGVARHRKIPNYTSEEVDLMVDVNVKGVIYGSQVAFRAMARRRSGHILNIASTAGTRGIPTESVYCATKFAVRGFTEALQEEAAPYGIRVTSILPGGVDTAFWDTAREHKPPVERFLRPEHIAKAIVSVLEMDDVCVTREIVLRSASDADLTLAENAHV